MKLISATIIYTMALIDQTTALSDFLKEAISNASAIANPSHARNFNHALDFPTPSHNYGCWCNWINTGNVGTGFGEPVDDLDAECKRLHDNYACLRVEEQSYNILYLKA